MFETARPHVFALPAGADFAAALVAGLRDRLRDAPPEAMARVQLFVPTTRLQRRILDLMTAEGAALLPRIRLVTDLGLEAALAGLPPAVPPLRRRLELVQLVRQLLDAQPDLAPRAALYDLADSLAALMDEMQSEGVDPETVSALDVSGHSAHWARAQRFMQIVRPFFGSDATPDPEARRRRTVMAMAERWAQNPPADPVILAGSTGSRGTTLLLMRAIAALPQGALVLPGFDPHMPQAVWDGLDNALAAQDHPQYRFRHLLDQLGLRPDQVAMWREAAAPCPARNRLISLSLRPAPVTDQWLSEGRQLTDLAEATAAMTLIEAESPRAEALAIALVLRQAAEDGRTAALVSPDRGLTRQVTAALDRWGIIPDDSAGKPLSLSAPGRLLRHVSRLIGERLTAEALLTLLKHPLVATGGDRGPHLRLTREYELWQRRRGPAFPDADALRNWARAQKDEAAGPWAEWIIDSLSGLEIMATAPLTDLLSRHLQVTEALARGPLSQAQSPTGALWLENAGEVARNCIAELQAEAAAGGSFHPADYRNLFDSLLSRAEVRDDVTGHPRLMIWGTLEARVQGAELVILGGLNDGIWPQSAKPDPWLNRRMRKDAGLLLPEREIGLAAHDYQQAIGAREVVLTRAHRDADAETVPSRWLNRLVNLLGGLPDQGGPAALAAMRDRGTVWLRQARALERPAQALAPAPRPAPRPPVAHRPRALALTRIGTLIRDPYAIYARYILRLFPLDPLHRSPDARLRGSTLHRILECFVKERPEGEARPAAHARLMAIATRILETDAPWPAARALWLARLNRAADFFLDQDGAEGGIAVSIEGQGRLRLDPLDFELFGTPDRIDALPDGRLHILDYKTGTPPTRKQQEQFDKQLLLAAAMAERGGFSQLGFADVARITYMGLGSSPKLETTPITPEITGKVWQDLHRLIGRYMQAETGYPARRAVFESRFPGDYDHLARFGEWEMTDRALPLIVGQEETR